MRIKREVNRNRRMKQARQNLKEIEKTIAPYVTERKILTRSTAGLWGTVPPIVDLWSRHPKSTLEK